MPTRYTIEDLQEFATYKGGKCLSNEFWDIETKYKWMCSKGHTWEAGFNIIKQGGWCPRCDKEAKTKEERLEELKAIAIERGGKLLADRYININEKLLWECGKGHQWYTKAVSVKLAKSWCPICIGRNKNIKDMQEQAAKRGGKCLSDKYINKRTKLEWQCGKGHVWKAEPCSITVNNTWCPICGRESCSEKQRDDIEIYRKIATEKGGKLLSDEYNNCNTKLLFECDKGHQWYTKAAIIKFGESWCPICAGKFKYTIKDMQRLAGQKGGKCLSKKYIDSKTKLKWQCSKGHIWETRPQHIVSDHWCPTCSFEANAELHRDNIETYREIAIKNEGKLLSDKYINGKTPLLWECSKGHQWKAPPDRIKHAKTWCPYCDGKHININDMQELADQRGGKCLSKVYINNHTKLEWRCNKGHQWKADLANVKDKKKWCPVCSSIERKGKLNIKSKDK